MNDPKKKERKQRIKAQNAERKLPPPLLSGGKYPEARKPMTDEEFHEQMFGFFLIIEGFCRLAGLHGKGFSKEEFPSELDVK